MQCLFRNDNDVIINLPDHYRTNTFIDRDNHEVLFRRISTWLINNKFIKRNIIDLGAWIGDNSIPWAKNISGTVYAIDPSDKNCDFINQVCTLNNITNVVTYQTAISDKKEVLCTHQSLDHCSFLLHGDTKVEAVSLDDLYAEGKIVDVDYVHLDVEGMEFKVASGMVNIIDAYHPIVAFEQHLLIDNIGEIVNFFKQRNYMVFLIDEELPECRTDCRNFIAFPNTEKFEMVIDHLRSYFGKVDIFTRF
jgi:FkbM family methyltransferase